MVLKHIILESQIKIACNNKIIPCHSWFWWSHFHHYTNKYLQLAQPDLEEILILCGFNYPEYLTLLNNTIMSSTYAKDSGDEKLSFMMEQPLKYKLLQSISPYTYLPALPSVEKAMLSLLKRQIQVIQFEKHARNTPLQKEK